MTRGGPRAGFVLVEALATLALSALVLAGAASLVGLMLRSADRTAMSVETLETTGRAVAAIERDLRAAVRVHRRVDELSTMVFLGSPEMVMVVVDKPGPAGLTVPTQVTWKSEVAASGRGRLTRSEAPLLPGVEPPAVGGGSSQVIDTGPSVIRFAYFGPMPEGEGEVLTDAWTSVEAMPRAVRVGRADPASLAVSSAVRVPLRVDAELGCANPSMGYCSLTPGRRVERPSAETDLLRRPMRPREPRR